VTEGGVFTEVSAVPMVRSVALSHVSIELGHLYKDDYDEGDERLREHFRQVAPWVSATAAQVGVKRPRVSHCFLIDDYFTPFATPREVVSALVEAAAESGLTIDYVARESGCARVGDLELAEVVRAHIVDEPPPGSNGGRPPVSKSGWLTNGERSPSTAAAAMSGPRGPWVPPSENAARNHSIFVDIELWRDEPGGRLWSCPFLAAVWQLQRLGLVRHLGEPVAEPVPAVPRNLPLDWAAMPAVVRLNPKAAPFRAYRTFSVLGSRFLQIELAVRTILSQVAVDPLVTAQVLERARAEGMALPAETVERISYLFG
jgi:hypothetical protein